jgi:hypothetical protein
MEKKAVIFARPKDRSLQSFKDFIGALGDHTDATDDLSEADYAKAHRDFWAKVDAGA